MTVLFLQMLLLEEAIKDLMQNKEIDCSDIIIYTAKCQIEQERMPWAAVKLMKVVPYASVCDSLIYAMVAKRTKGKCLHCEKGRKYMNHVTLIWQLTWICAYPVVDIYLHFAVVQFHGIPHSRVIFY